MLFIQNKKKWYREIPLKSCYLTSGWNKKFLVELLIELFFPCFYKKKKTNKILIFQNDKHKIKKKIEIKSTYILQLLDFFSALFNIKSVFKEQFNERIKSRTYMIFWKAVYHLDFYSNPITKQSHRNRIPSVEKNK